MTTILIDFEERLVVSDTRVTNSGFGRKDTYEVTTKVFTSKCGKFVMTGSGSCKQVHQYMRRYGLGLKGFTKDRVDFGDKSTIMLLNKYNSTVKCVEIRQGIFGAKVTSYYLNGKYIKHLAHGSGASVVKNLGGLVSCPIKAVRYAAMKDKFTNDLLQITKF